MTRSCSSRSDAFARFWLKLAAVKTAARARHPEETARAIKEMDRRERERGWEAGREREKRERRERDEEEEEREKEMRNSVSGKWPYTSRWSVLGRVPLVSRHSAAVGGLCDCQVS